MTEFRDFVALNYRHESVSSPEKGLKRSLKPILRELAARFDDLDSIDRIVAAHGKAQAVVEKMATNLKLADERQNLLEAREAETRHLAESSKRLFTAMTRAKYMVKGRCWRRYRCCCIIATMILLALACIAAAIVVTNYTSQHWW